MKTFLINLERSPERLAFMKEQLDRLGLPFLRIPAVDGRALSPSDRARRFSRVRSFIAAKKRLSDAEIGVALSHGDCCRRMVAENVPLALVLEDDVALADGFPEALARAEKFLDPSRPQVAVFSGYGIAGGETLPPEIRRVSSLWCADAYCLTLAAAKLILKANDPVLTVADSFKRWRKRFGLELYRVFPTTAKQEDERFASENTILPKSNWLVRNVLWLADWVLWKATGR